jgi:hypothetical protein
MPLINHGQFLAVSTVSLPQASDRRRLLALQYHSIPGICDVADKWNHPKMKRWIYQVFRLSWAELMILNKSYTSYVKTLPASRELNSLHPLIIVEQWDVAMRRRSLNLHCDMLYGFCAQVYQIEQWTRTLDFNEEHYKCSGLARFEPFDLFTTLPVQKKTSKRTLPNVPSKLERPRRSSTTISKAIKIKLRTECQESASTFWCRCIWICNYP